MLNTGLTVGTSFWDTGLLTFLRLDHVIAYDQRLGILDIPLNGAFMFFGGLGLAFNITTRYNPLIIPL